MLNGDLGIDGAPVYRTSKDAQISAHDACNARDVVLVKQGETFQAGEVWLHADVHGEVFSIVSLWNCKHIDRDTQSADWWVRDNPTMIDTSDILTATINRRPQNGVVRTLLPASVR